MINVGIVNNLQIDRSSDHGLFLTSDGEDSVLLPKVYVTNDMQIGENIDVFIYTDSEDRVVATTLSPKAKLEEFGSFKVVDTTKFGAFVDWGLPKDLFVPKALQRRPFRVGEQQILKVIKDRQSERLIGTAKFKNDLKRATKHLKPFMKTDILVFHKSPMGFSVVVDNQYEGMLYHNEIFEKVSTGDQKVAYIKNIRPDGKLDMSLQPIGGDSDANESKVLNILDKHDGKLPMNYKSSPELIQEMFSMSKKNYKRTLTSLQEKGKITISDEGIQRL
jgi:predicted RNA-binding protein (virulence factor B family)